MSEFQVFIPVILAYGLCSAYFDVKYRKVPNWLTGLAMLTGLALHVLLVWKVYMLYGIVNIKYIIDQILNTVVAMAFALTFYYIDLIAPGDGKMIIAYSILIPVSAYHRGYFWPYPGIVHLAVSYVLAYLAVLARAISPESRHELIEGARELLRPKTIATLMITVTGVSTIFLIVSNALNLPPNPAATVILAVIFIVVTQKISQRIVIGVSTIGCIIWVYMLLKGLITAEQIPQLVSGMLILGTIFYPLRRITHRKSDDIFPMGVFFFVGAVVTLLLVT